MRTIFAAAAALTLAAQAPAPDVKDLAWLSGVWVAREGDRWTEDYWTPPRGGIMIGAGLTGRGDRAGAFEHMRIMADQDGRVGFYGMPGGAPAVRFPLVKSGRGEAVFENAAHDYPQRIRYRLEAGTLTATVSLLDGSRAQSWAFKRPQ